MEFLQRMRRDARELGVGELEGTFQIVCLKVPPQRSFIAQREMTWSQFGF